MKKLIRLPIFLLAFSSLVNAQEAKGLLAQEEDLRESVFRYQFEHVEHDASGLEKGAKFYFLSIRGEKLGRAEGQDPSNEFLKRFEGIIPTVKKVSQCSKMSGVRDKETGEEGLIVFQDGRIQWISDTEVEVGGGYYRGNQGSSSGEYRVVKEGSRWVVKKGEMLLIS